MEDIIVPVVFFICTAFTIVGLPLARAYARRLDRRSTSTDSPEVVQRLERMEQAIDSIAVEVERISEANRFMRSSSSER